MKEVLRYLLFLPAFIIGDGYFTATEGTLWCRFLVWLYGEENMGIIG